MDHWERGRLVRFGVLQHAMLFTLPLAPERLLALRARGGRDARAPSTNGIYWSAGCLHTACQSQPHISHQLLFA